MIPVVEPMEATAVLELDHVPPTIAKLSVAQVPVHTVDGPVIRHGTHHVFTATVVVI